jgi:copper chaperone CopZ
VTGDPAAVDPVTLSVAGMTCGTCEDSIQRALGLLPQVRSVRADHRAGRVEVELISPLSEDSIRQAVEDAGYDLEGVGTR